jgi:cytochrome c oxidase subunit 3
MIEPQFEAHFQDWENERRSGHFGMWVFVASEVLFFTALFALYAGYRAHYPVEFSEASKHSKLALGTANTYVLITSSLFVALSIDAFRRDKVRLALLLQGLTVALALVFLLLKGIEYSQHFHEGIYPGEAYHFKEVPGHGGMLFFTLYYCMTGLHAIHVIVGIGLFSWLMARTAKGRYSSRAYMAPTLIGIYWHFVDVIWIFLWPMFYLIH